MPKKIKSTISVPQSFEEAMTELNQLVATMEKGELPLEASLTLYQRGSDLIKYCSNQLNSLEEQVTILQKGMLTPFTLDPQKTEGEDA